MVPQGIIYILVKLDILSTIRFKHIRVNFIYIFHLWLYVVYISAALKMIFGQWLYSQITVCELKFTEQVLEKKTQQS